MTKKKLGGNTYMVMFLGTQSTNLCLQRLLVLAPSYLFCKYVYEIVLFSSI